MDLPIEPPDRTSAMIVTPRPFARAEDVALIEVTAGRTIAEMLDLSEDQGHLDPSVRPFVRVFAGDQVVPAHLWPIARPKAGVTLFVDVAPRGGSNATRVMLQLAVIAISLWLPGAFGLSGMAAAFASAAMPVGGALPTFGAGERE